jgi:hypothetical protein
VLRVHRYALTPDGNESRSFTPRSTTDFCDHYLPLTTHPPHSSYDEPYE